MSDCFERFKLGCVLGGTVGAAMGLLLGSYSVLKFGHGGNGFIRTVGKSALQSGSMFGLFMGIGGLIRCEINEGQLLSKNVHNREHDLFNRMVARKY